MRWIKAVLLPAALLALGLTAASATKDTAMPSVAADGICPGGSAAATIAGCTRVIDAGGAGPNAYYNRGLARYWDGQYDGAVADESIALRLKPDMADAYRVRGDAYFHTGKFDLAVADYSGAIRLNPAFPTFYYLRAFGYEASGQPALAEADYAALLALKSDAALAYIRRGTLRFSLGRFDDAAADLTQAVALKPADAYAALLLHVAHGRAGRDDADAFAANLAKADTGRWPGRMLRDYFAGKISLDGVLATQSGEDAQVHGVDLCQGTFLIGEFEMLHHKTASAARYLAMAANACGARPSTTAAARADLKLLQAPPKK